MNRSFSPLAICSKSFHPVSIEVDLSQFTRNLKLIQQFIAPCSLCLPIKANAYGHGLCAIGKAAEKAGVNTLAVAHLGEGIALRKEGISIPILVLGAIHKKQVPDLIQFQLEITISSLYKARLVAEECERLNKRCQVHLEVDTGMQRTGVRPQTALALFDYLKVQKCFEIRGIYSHLATSDRLNDPFAFHQIREFRTLLSSPLFSSSSLCRHLANSGGTVYYPESHLDMVRPALLAFGHFPAEHCPALQGIAPCFSLKAKVSYFKVIEKGTGISYGHSYVSDRSTRIVTIPIGYGDGYPRRLSNRGFVLIRGQRCPIVGAICMDQCMVDVGKNEVYVGDEVVLIGKQGNEEISVMEIAELCDTIPYEVLCFFNERIPRIYTEIT